MLNQECERVQKSVVYPSRCVNVWKYRASVHPSCELCLYPAFLLPLVTTNRASPAVAAVDGQQDLGGQVCTENEWRS